jgi:hypothetical protein
VALGQRDRNLAGGAPVELRRGARPRATPSGQPPVFDIEQTLLDQLVEVELGDVPRQARARGGLIPAHRFPLGYEVEIQRAPRRFGERADPRDLRGEVVQRSHHLLKDTSIDLTPGKPLTCT